MQIAITSEAIEQVGTPTELYETPNSIFVAGFIGSPKMNFLEVEVKEATGGRVTAAPVDGTKGAPMLASGPSRAPRRRPLGRTNQDHASMLLLDRGRELVERRQVLWLLVVRDLKVRYASSKLGYVWTVLDPLMMSGVYFLVFGIFFHDNRPPSRLGRGHGYPFAIQRPKENRAGQGSSQHAQFVRATGEARGKKQKKTEFQTELTHRDLLHHQQYARQARILRNDFFGSTPIAPSGAVP